MTTTRERALEEALRDIRAMLAHAQDSGDDGVADYIERADMALGAALPPSAPGNSSAREAIEAILARAKREPMAVTWHRLQECINDMAALALQALEALPPSSEPQPAPVASEKWQFGQRGADKAGPFWRNVHIPGRPVATAFSFTSQNEADARARLIAAAPEMLAALRALVSGVKSSGYYAPDAWPPSMDKPMFDALAAITRATGREG